MTSIRFIAAAAASLVAATPAFAAPIQPTGISPANPVMVVATYDRATHLYCVASLAPAADAEVRSAVRVGRCATERAWNRRGIAFHATRATLDSLPAAPIASVAAPAKAG